MSVPTVAVEGSNVPVAITSAGQVGIGRNDPTQALEIRNGNILLSNNNNTGGELRIAEPSSSGSYYTSFKAGAQSATINYTLPITLPAANNGILTSSTAGVLSWGSNLAWDNTNARLGANTTSPSTTIDANGDLALRENAFTAGNGNNNDIAIGNYSFVRISGPNAAFTITGIGGGVNGKMVVSPILVADHTIAMYMLPRRFLHCDHVAATAMIVNLNHLGKTARFTLDDHVGKEHRKGLVANDMARAPYGMAQT